MSQQLEMPGKSFWDASAPSAFLAPGDEGYALQFTRLTAVRPGETVLDMGCGPGEISALLARGASVVAADFSARMLEAADQLFQHHAVAAARTMRLDWREDWTVRGIGPRSFDVCAASRSLAVDPIEKALVKLDRVARRRVCVTACADVSPRVDARLMRELGIVLNKAPDSQQVASLLAQRGAQFERCGLTSEKHATYADEGEALDHHLRMVERALGCAADAQRYRAQVQTWLDGQLEPCDPDRDGADSASRLRLRQPRAIHWEFFAWQPGIWGL